MAPERDLDSGATPASSAETRKASEAGVSPAPTAEELRPNPVNGDAAPEISADPPHASDAPAPPPPVGEQQAEAAASADADHEAQLEHDLEELAARAEKADEYLELAQRTKADFENYRRRAAKEAAAAKDRGVAKLARELLPAVDNLDRALAATDGADDSDTLVSGIKLVHADVIAALGRVGIEPYSPEGERFDPEHHEAVAQQPVEGAEPGTIVEVYQRGYRLGDSILRPARVVVAG
jgi:molecular chaperone GrpE